MRFGVSVCRACCVAQFTASDPSVNPDAFTDDLCNYPPDSDSVVKSMTNANGHELVPRFDMHHQSNKLFQYGLVDGRDNNLFVHGGYTSQNGPGKGRGCKYDGVFTCLNTVSGK